MSKRFLSRRGQSPNNGPIKAGKHGITTAQLRGGESEASSDIRQRVGATRKMMQVGDSNGEIQLITDLRKTINTLQGRPGGGGRNNSFEDSAHSGHDDRTTTSSRSSAREFTLSTKNLPNRQRESSPKTTIHSRLNSKNSPKEEKHIWNLRRPDNVRNDRDRANRKRNEELDDELMNSRTKVPRRAVVNDLLRLSDSDNDDYRDSRDSHAITKIVRGKRTVKQDPKKLSTSSVQKSKSSIKKTFTVDNEKPEPQTKSILKPKQKYREPEVILPPPKKLPSANITDGSITVFHQWGAKSIPLGPQQRPSHNKTLADSPHTYK